MSRKGVNLPLTALLVLVTAESLPGHYFPKPEKLTVQLFDFEMYRFKISICVDF